MGLRAICLLSISMVTISGWHCAPDYPELPIFVEEMLGCQDIATFGDGSLCVSPGEDGLGVCGESGGCSPEGVCVQDKVFLGCRCFNDQDCVGWADYVNESKGGLGEEPLTPVCYAGGCIFSAQMHENELADEEEAPASEDAEVDGN